MYKYIYLYVITESTPLLFCFYSAVILWNIEKLQPQSSGSSGVINKMMDHSGVWTAKPVISSTAIIVALANNTLNGSKLSISL